MKIYEPFIFRNLYLEMRRVTIEYKEIPIIQVEARIPSTIRFYGKKAPYFELSNYYPLEIVAKGASYPTSENYYQAQKFMYDSASSATLEYSEIVAQANTPNKARILALQKTGGGYKWRTDLNTIIQQYKKKGATINPSWDDIKDTVMRHAVYAKFRSTKLQDMLIQTYPAHLIEASPRDEYWGEGKDGTGKNRLGNILEEVRFILRILEGTPTSPHPSPYFKAQWVIPDILIASSYIESEEIVKKFIKEGKVTVFVDLVNEEQRQKLELYPYFTSLEFDQIYLHFPIEDRKINNDEETFRIVSTIASLISSGEVVLIHCLGGKGRTGVIVALLMWQLYGMDAEDVLQFTENNFQMREDKGKRCPHSPQTKAQINQVNRIINNY